MVDCCKHSKRDKQCKRKSDKKTFKLPRKISRKKCRKPKGFTMKSSCAPYKDCYLKKGEKPKSYKLTKEGKKWMKAAAEDMKKREALHAGGKDFLYNPDDPKKSFDVYIDKNPKDTIHIKYTTIEDVTNTIKKLERLYKSGKYPHKRIWQVGMIMKVRLEVLRSKKPKQYKLAERYFKHLGKRTKIKDEKSRKKFTFKI